MRPRDVIPWAALGLSLLAGPASGRPYAPWPDFDSLAVRYPGAAAVYLLDEREASLRDLGGEHFGKHETVTRSIAILDPAKAEEWLEVTIPSSSLFKVVRLAARTWTGPQTSVDVKGSNIFDVSSFADYVLYSDVRGKKFAFPAASARCVVEYRYEIETTLSFTLDHTFAHAIPTLRSRAVLNVPAKWLALGFHEIVRAQGVPAEPVEDVTRDPDGDVLHLGWELSEVPAIRAEPAMPAWSDIAPHVVVLPLPLEGGTWDWARQGKDYWQEYFAPRLGKEPEIAALSSRLLEGATTPEERLARLARFVARDVRYVAIELGIGGYQPHRAADVLKNRYGDCKDKVCLLLSLLGAVGIAGDPVLVRTADLGMLDTNLVDLGQFNHMIARVRLGDRAVWIDPTAASSPPGELPWVDQATWALVVTPEGSHLEPTPTALAEENEMRTLLDGALSPEGDLTGWLTFEGEGAAGAGQRAAFRARDAAESRRLVAALLENRLPGARLIDFALSDPDSVDRPFRLRAQFERPGGALVVDRNLVLLPQVVCVEHLAEGFADSARTYAVELGYLRRYRDRVRIAPPEGYAIEAPASPLDFAGRWFAFGRRAQAEPGAFAEETTLANRALTVPPAQFRAAREELAGFRRALLARPVRFRAGP